MRQRERSAAYLPPALSCSEPAAHRLPYMERIAPSSNAPPNQLYSGAKEARRVNVAK